MTANTEGVAVYARIAVDPTGDVEALDRVVAGHRAEGASGVVLEAPSWVADDRGGTLRRVSEAQGRPGAGNRPFHLVVEVGSAADAVEVLGAGADGVLLGSDTDLALVEAVVGFDAGADPILVWFTDGADRRHVSRATRCCRVFCEGQHGVFDRGDGPDAVVRAACVVPPAAEAGPGVIEALTTMAVAAGARALRCHDIRTVRRCADVAMELVVARDALGGPVIGELPQSSEFG